MGVMSICPRIRPSACPPVILSALPSACHLGSSTRRIGLLANPKTEAGYFVWKPHTSILKVHWVCGLIKTPKSSVGMSTLRPRSGLASVLSL